MNRFKIIALITFAFLLSSQVAVFAQGYRYKKSEKHQKEYYKNQKERRKYEEKRQKERRKYLEKQRKERIKYQKKINKLPGRVYPNSTYNNRIILPSWAKAHRYTAKRHVYFRDYNVFYDARRQGYVYLHKNKWRFSKAVPSYLIGVDLNRARIQVLNDLAYTSRPELYHSRYAKRYPRDMRIQFNLSLF